MALLGIPQAVFYGCGCNYIVRCQVAWESFALTLRSVVSDFKISFYLEVGYLFPDSCVIGLVLFVYGGGYWFSSMSISGVASATIAKCI